MKIDKLLVLKKDVVDYLYMNNKDLTKKDINEVYSSINRLAKKAYNEKRGVFFNGFVKYYYVEKKNKNGIKQSVQTNS